MPSVLSLFHFDASGNLQIPCCRSYEDHHRDIVQDALTKQKLCPNCEAPDCGLKCARCKSIYYCNSHCQLAHWPEHKKICNEFNSVAKVFRGMACEDMWDFNGDISSVLYARLRMIQVDCEVIKFYELLLIIRNEYLNPHTGFWGLF